jgi:enamine deaminase RidA (YjgF/YER057c/UK114 family)
MSVARTRLMRMAPSPAPNIGVQTTQALANVERTLAAAGARLEHVVKWTVYVVAG